MKMSVVIPTYRRADVLRRCLASLAKQARQADQVIVVTRKEDAPSRDAAGEWLGQLPIVLRQIDRPGVVQAMNLGLTAVAGDIVVFADDDTEAPEDWLQRIEQHYLADDKLGGLGGRDIVHENGSFIPATEPLVGRIEWFGRVVGNHHIGVGPAREVDHLKGANMSFRMRAIEGLEFDTALRGSGAQVFFELAFSLKVANRGWRLVYDPAVWLDHYPAPRFDSDKRSQPALDAVENAAYNFYYSLRHFLRPAWKRWAALTWAYAIGTAGHPGALRGLQSQLRGDAQGVALRQIVARAWRDARREANTSRPQTTPATGTGKS